MSSGKCAAKVLTLLTLAGVAFAAENIRKDLHFKVGNRPVISINNRYGPITVKAGAPHEVRVTAILHSDKVELDQSRNGHRIGITSHILPGADESTSVVEYLVQVPPDANLTLHSGTGPVHAEKLHGDVIMEGTDGSIEVLDCADGALHVRTLNGPVSLSNVHSGHLEVWSMGGDVIMTRVSGPFVQVNSNSGKIEYDGDFGDEGEYAFTSHTGSIEAVAPAYASIDVLARSTNGQVQSDFSLEPKHPPFIIRGANSLSGTLGKAASSVKLFSFSGKIRLKKRQD
jgi:hypothetical protein